MTVSGRRIQRRAPDGYPTHPDQRHWGLGERDAICANNVNSGSSDVLQKADAILNGAAILILPEVASVSQELVNEVAVGSVDLNTVEASRDGVAGRRTKVVGDALDILDSQRSCRDVALFARIGMSES